MVDYHVDRPGVEAPQGVELTGTNSSEILLTHTNRSSRATWKFFSIQLSRRDRLRAQARRLAGDQVSGAHGGGVPPVPIPNTAVKPASADDSRTAGSLESRSVPDLINEEARHTSKRWRASFNYSGLSLARSPEETVPS